MGRRIRLFGQRTPPKPRNIRKCPYCRSWRVVSSFSVVTEHYIAASACKFCAQRKAAGLQKWWADQKRERKYDYRPEPPEVVAARRARGRRRWELIKKHGISVLREEGLLK